MQQFPINSSSSVAYLCKSGNTFGHFDAADLVFETFTEMKNSDAKTMMFRGQTAIIYNNGNTVELIKTESTPNTFYDFVIRRFPVFSSKEALDQTISDIASTLNQSGRSGIIPTKAFSVGMIATVKDDEKFKTYAINKIESTTTSTDITVNWVEVPTNGLIERTSAETVSSFNNGDSLGVVSVGDNIYSYVDEEGKTVWTSDKTEASLHVGYKTYPSGVYATTTNATGDIIITSLSNDVIDCGSWED